MEYIDINNWDRKEHYHYFQKMDYPHFNICANIEITNFLRYVKANKLQFYYAMIHASTYTANGIVNFRYRVRGDKVVLHEKTHPCFTVMENDSNLFKKITAEMKDDIMEFTEQAVEKAQSQKEYFASDELERDDLIYMTCTPWIAFTHISHTISLDKNDSAPRISWGKYFTQDDKVFLPFSVQVHHSLADGAHIGQYYTELQSYINNLK